VLAVKILPTKSGINLAIQQVCINVSQSTLG